MNLELSPFNWSLKKLLLTEPDTFNRSRIKIVYTILIIAMIKAIIVIPSAYQHDQYFQIGRGFTILILDIFLIKLLLFNKAYIKVISHFIVLLGIFLIWSNIFVTVLAINLVTVQLVFMVILSGFYLLDIRSGVIYSLIGTLPILIHLMLFGKQPLQISGAPQELASPAYEIIVFLNFITIFISHYLFHQAFRANINEKIVLNQELQEAVSEANKYANSKADFLSTMSHELRTPLNSVIGITELLLDDPHTDEQKENLDILSFSALSLRTLINDILDFSKIESGKLHFETISINLNDLVSRICGGLRLQANEKGLSFKLNIDEEIKGKNIITDPTRLTQIIYNLVGNAIKFTHKGNVTVSLRAIEKNDEEIKIRFSIADTGIGISPDKHEAIFEPFTQASRDTTRTFGGTGLGLAIVKRLLLLFDSTINLESSPESGSNFSFDILFKFDKETMHIDAKGIESDQDLSGLRVLVAEDNPMNVLLLRKILTKWNVEPVFTENGLQAIEKLSSATFDVILMDIHMPVMDGYLAIKEIRSSPDPAISTIPIIALTASVSITMKDVDITDYIYKPFSSKELYAKLKKIRR